MSVPPAPGSPPGDEEGVPGSHAPVPPAAGPPPAPGAVPQPPMYAAPGRPVYYYAPPPRTNGMAIASMVLGIVWIYWVGSILALIFGYVARRQIQERHEGGGGMATAGIVLGWVGVGVLALVLVVALAAYGAS
ncbi:DUF4190 domain-containing protein [Streptomyces hoynatensis]|uniref:DUF4190 domain-containing protein n=1 Tax=Streptomyces hoynatensis TaxID=1141874 RepID=A0A3A9Z9S0_9ACTN|nr:DUF4190 domain-containing protein [Streptomyces hoynatensis]RKN44968.1 DUF4190 domain-containing protein [Streptomyces hoynatensis]